MGWYRRFEVPASPAASSFRDFKSISGTRIGYLLVPLCFRSSCQRVPRCITDFGSRALARKEYLVNEQPEHQPPERGADAEQRKTGGGGEKGREARQPILLVLHATQHRAAESTDQCEPGDRLDQDRWRAGCIADERDEKPLPQGLNREVAANAGHDEGTAGLDIGTKEKGGRVAALWYRKVRG